MRKKISWVLVLLLCAAGCKRDGGDPDRLEPTDSEEDFQRVFPTTMQCDISPSATVGDVFDRVELSGAVPDLEEIAIRVTHRDVDLPMLATVFKDDGGTFFSVPLPPEPREGGTLTLQITNGEESCEPFEFEVRPLAATELSRTQQLMDELEREASEGLTSVGLTATEADSLIGLEDGILKVQSDDAEVIGRLISYYLTLSDENPTSLARLRSSLTDDELSTTSALMEQWRRQVAAEPTGLVPHSAPAALTSLAACFSLEVPQETTAENLSEAIATCGRPACNVVRAYDDAALDYANLISSGLGSALGAGVLTFTSISVISKIHSAMRCAEFPEKLFAVQVEPGSLDFEEDFEGEKPIVVEVTAVSGPAFNISGRAAQGLLQILGVGIGVQGVKNWYLSAESKLIDAALQELQVVVDFLAILTSNLATDVGEDVDLTFRAPPVTAILDSLDYVDLISTTDRSLGVEVDGGLGVRPLKVGEDLINIVPKLEKFPGAVVSTELPVNVQAISVFLDPTIKVVLPGTTHPVKYEVFGALNPALEWLPPSNDTGMTPGRFETFEASGVVDVTVPADEARFPHVVGVTPLSNDGLRGVPNPPSRRVQAIFLLDGLTVGPSLPCVRENESVKLWAAAAAGATITWTGSNLSATSGEEVMFNAPSVGEAGETFEVKVLAELGPDQMWEAALEIFVGECACREFFRSNGAGVAGGSFQYSVTLTRGASADGWEYQAQWSNRFIMMWSGPDQLTDGVYPASLIAAGTPFATEERAGSLKLEVDENGSFIGHFTGILLDGEDPPNQVLVQADFDAVADFSSADSTSPHCRSKTLHDGWRRQRE